MSSKRKVSLLLFGLLGLLVVGILCFLAYRQVTALWRSQEKAPASTQLPPQFDMGNLSAFIPKEDPPVPRVSHAMSEAFNEGLLPTPLQAPAENPDDAAVNLAKQIAARDESSTPALITALQLAGFSIRSNNGSITHRPVNSSQGMVFDAWQVAAMAKLYDEHWQLSLDDLSVVLTKCIPELGKLPLNDLFLKGIADSSQGSQPLRFWSRLIVELGRNSGERNDLLAKDVDPKAVQLDAIQVSLIMVRVWGDLRAGVKHVSPKGKAAAYHFLRQEPFRLEPAVYHPRNRVRLLRTFAGDSGGLCQLNDAGMTENDIFAIATTTEWKSLVGMAEHEGGMASKISAGLLLLKMLLIYSSLHGDVTIDGSPLVRTKDLDKGETKTLTARVWFELDKWPILNCLRPLLNLGHIDFGNLPNNGAADGVGVSWYLTAGGVDPSVTTQNIQKFLAAQDAASVMFDNGSGHEGETWNTVTDKDGKVTMKVSGRPQKRDLTHFKLATVRKKMSVAIEVKLKGADVEKFVGEFTDVIGPALGVASGDVLTGVLGGLTELAFRMHWQVEKSFDFPVKDWRACEKGWLGTITYSREINSVRTESGPVPNIGTGEKIHALKLTEKREYTINGSEGTYESSQLHTEWSGEYERKKQEIATAHGSSYWCKSVSFEDKTQETLTGNDSATADFNLEIGPSKYRLMLMPRPQDVNRPVLAGETLHHRVDHNSGPNGGASPAYCQDEDSTEIHPIERRPWMTFFQTVQGTIDPQKPEELTGTQEFPDPEDPSSKIVIKWDLIHCGN